MDSISVANSGVTSSSTTSEGCSQAVTEACAILVERLTPLYKQCQDAAPNGEVEWEDVISKVPFQSKRSSQQVSTFGAHTFLL